MSLPIRAQAVAVAGLLAGGATFVALSSAAAPAAAAVTCARYADPSGSDSNAGTATSPFRTAQKVVSSLSAGQTGCLNAGTYSGNVTISTSGVTLRSTPGSRATLTLNTLQINDGANGVIVSDLNIIGGGGALTMRPIGDHFQILRNDITNNNAGMTCVLVGGGSITTSGGVIADNRIHNCGAVGNTLDHGIYAQNFAPDSSGGPGLTIQDNIFWGYAAYAVQLYPKGVGAVVDHNVMDASSISVRGGVVIDGTLAQNDTISHNVIYHTATGGIVQRTGSGHQALDNCFYANPTNISGSGITSVGNVTANPGFADLAAHNYTLAPGSLCLTTVGYDIQSALTTAWSDATSVTSSPSASPSSSTASAAPTVSSSPSPTATASPTASAAPTASATTQPTATATTTSTNLPPTVSIVSPTAGQTVKNDLHAIADASDAQGIAKVELIVDGTVLGTEYSAPYDQWLSVRKLSKGKHTFTAKAFDTTGLTTSVSTYFYKR